MSDQTVKSSGKALAYKGSFSKIILMAGAICAFTIGSGFATGQEVLQYFASYGFWGIFGTGSILVIMLVIAFTISARIGHEQKFTRPTQIFQFLGGRVVGTALDYFYIIFMFLLFAMMIAGGGALFYEHYGVSTYIGGFAVALVVTATAWFGLRNLIGIIGRIGPLIVVIAIGLGIVGLFNASDGLVAGHQASSNLEIIQASSHWFPAGVSYSGVVILMLVPFVGSLGFRADNRRQARAGSALGAITFAFGCVVVGLGLLANIGRVYNVDIPLMVLARDVSPVVSSLISVVILAGIYTTAVPLLWAVSSRFYDDSTTGFKVVTIMAALLGSVIGLLVPFAQLVSWIFQASGYIGVLVFALAVFHYLFRRRQSAKPGEASSVSLSRAEKSIDVA